MNNHSQKFNLPAGKNAAFSGLCFSLPGLINIQSCKQSLAFRFYSNISKLLVLLCILFTYKSLICYRIAIGQCGSKLSNKLLSSKLHKELIQFSTNLLPLQLSINPVADGQITPIPNLVFWHSTLTSQSCQKMKITIIILSWVETFMRKCVNTYYIIMCETCMFF